MELSVAPRPNLDGRLYRVAIAVARFNDAVTRKLLAGAIATLDRAQVATDRRAELWVPGAFELPLACRWAVTLGGFHAAVALGCVIRGDTDHYDYVCQQTSFGLMQIQLDTGCPVGFGLLTCDTAEQAFARAGGAVGNAGESAAAAALEMLALGERLGRRPL